MSNNGTDNTTLFKNKNNYILKTTICGKRVAGYDLNMKSLTHFETLTCSLGSYFFTHVKNASKWWLPEGNRSLTVLTLELYLDLEVFC